MATSRKDLGGCHIGMIAALVGGVVGSLVAASTATAGQSATATNYEAEEAVIHRGVVESNHPGFTGAGFVNYHNETGSYVEWTVDAAGTASVLLAFHYANGTSANRAMDIAVNGRLAAHNLVFDGTGAWTSWQVRTATVTLDPGSNTIRATAVTSNGGPNVDRLTVAEPFPIDYQAEVAVIHRGVVESNHPGFTGAGFVNYHNETGSYVEWTVDAAEAGSFLVGFRYANGAGADRPMDIAVNDALAVDNLNFDRTNSWSSWQIRMATVTLGAGSNRIRATAVTSDGGPNVDKITVTAIDYQAERAVIDRGRVESNHPGFTGTGFVNYDNQTGSYVEWTVDAADTGSFLIGFRYANGTSRNRPMDIAVNGALAVENLAFDGTGSWSSWQITPTTLTLNPGSNRIRATAVTSNGGPNVDKLTILGPDWSTAVVESTMKRFTPKTLGPWAYTRGLYLYGQYLVYQRTQDPQYLAYIKSWADRFVDSTGNISQSFDKLDNMQPGNLLLILYQETGEARYRIAAKKIWERLRTYPHTSDGGWWHAASLAGQLWADGVFMVNPFVIRYGQLLGDVDEASWGNNESARQLQVYASHLERTDDSAAGLLYHAYDEPGGATASWVHPEFGNTNGVSWCRAIGWYGMAAIDVLERLPAGHPRRPALINILRDLVDAFDRHQDRDTGRWFQVVTHGSDQRNWTETSCSAMYSFTISRAVERGYVDPEYRDVARKGYEGVLASISIGSDGLTKIRDIAAGTNVSDTLGYYYGRPRPENSLLGLGAFLIMNEQMIRTGGG